ncbi:hypothetical protein VP01_37g3 [Puccinia sorghi]|uniref:Uncharacterized protein n=1 Tax=Puccinia sorghi TaxID=27349 RepID=A0A0L6UTI4_9BASI|nr:hypothetical protein VP01_37g3 [Puccinia sorghi]
MHNHSSLEITLFFSFSPFFFETDLSLHSLFSCCTPLFIRLMVILSFLPQLNHICYHCTYLRKETMMNLACFTGICVFTPSFFFSKEKANLGWIGWPCFLHCEELGLNTSILSTLEGRWPVICRAAATWERGGLRGSSPEFGISIFHLLVIKTSPSGGTIKAPGFGAFGWLPIHRVCFSKHVSRFIRLHQRTNPSEALLVITSNHNTSAEYREISGFRSGLQNTDYYHNENNRQQREALSMNTSTGIPSLGPGNMNTTLANSHRSWLYQGCLVPASWWLALQVAQVEFEQTLVLVRDPTLETDKSLNFQCIICNKKVQMSGAVVCPSFTAAFVLSCLPPPPPALLWLVVIGGNGDFWALGIACAIDSPTKGPFVIFMSPSIQFPEIFSWRFLFFFFFFFLRGGRLGFFSLEMLKKLKKCFLHLTLKGSSCTTHGSDFLLIFFFFFFFFFFFDQNLESGKMKEGKFFKYKPISRILRFQFTGNHGWTTNSLQGLWFMSSLAGWGVVQVTKGPFEQVKLVCSWCLGQGDQYLCTDYQRTKKRNIKHKMKSITIISQNLAHEWALKITPFYHPLLISLGKVFKQSVLGTKSCIQTHGSCHNCIDFFLSEILQMIFVGLRHLITSYQKYVFQQKKYLQWLISTHVRMKLMGLPSLLTWSCKAYVSNNNNLCLINVQQNKNQAESSKLRSVKWRDPPPHLKPLALIKLLNLEFLVPMTLPLPHPCSISPFVFTQACHHIFYLTYIKDGYLDHLIHPYLTIPSFDNLTPKSDVVGVVQPIQGSFTKPLQGDFGIVMQMEHHIHNVGDSLQQEQHILNLKVHDFIYSNNSNKKASNEYMLLSCRFHQHQSNQESFLAFPMSLIIQISDMKSYLNSVPHFFLKDYYTTFKTKICLYLMNEKPSMSDERGTMHI